jgi:hypothetical protein
MIMNLSFGFTSMPPQIIKKSDHQKLIMCLDDNGNRVGFKKNSQQLGFPESRCLAYANISVFCETDMRIVRVALRWKQDTAKFTMYTFTGYTDQIEKDFQALVEAKANSQSVGETYHRIFSKRNYPYHRKHQIPKQK